MRIHFVLAGLIFGGTAVSAAVDALVVENQQWREERVTRLTISGGETGARSAGKTRQSGSSFGRLDWLQMGSREGAKPRR